jgi:hypothetical protein
MISLNRIRSSIGFASVILLIVLGPARARSNRPTGPSRLVEISRSVIRALRQDLGIRAAEQKIPG